MPEIKAFPAIRYDYERTSRDLSKLVAPPYDVLNQNDKNALLAGNERNIVAIDLPHIPPKSAGPAEVYERSAALLAQWLGEGTLVQETQPAMYLYHQRFEHAGKAYTRRKFIARVRLQPFSEGSILPHEKTFGGPKEDRLALMKATSCQLSPIFGLFADSEDQVGSAFAPIAEAAPHVTARLDGVENRMWIVTDRVLCDRIVSIMANKKVYIADGHHRYGTALMYRDWFREQHAPPRNAPEPRASARAHARTQTRGALAQDHPDAQATPLPAEHPANYVMFVLASMEDPGCLILPYNRALADVELTTVLDAWSPGTGPCAVDQADIVVVDGRTGKEVALRFTARDKLTTLAPDQCEAWHKLDYAYLHRYLLDELLRRHLGTEPQVRYVKSAGDARQTAGDESGVALLLNATPMAHVRAVSEAGGLMPQKSTYFHPKLATGLTINPLT